MAQKRVRDLVRGDRTEWWTVVHVYPVGVDIRVDVRFPDGGIGMRIWDDPSHEVAIEEASPSPSPFDIFASRLEEAVHDYDASGDHSKTPGGEHGAQSDCVRCAVVRALGSMFSPKK